MIADRECWERGCACHDTWNKGVEVVEKRTWVGLTDEEVDNFLNAAWSKGVTPADFIRAIEAKIKEKNNG